MNLNIFSKFNFYYSGQSNVYIFLTFPVLLVTPHLAKYPIIELDNMLRANFKSKVEDLMTCNFTFKICLWHVVQFNSVIAILRRVRHHFPEYYFLSFSKFVFFTLCQELDQLLFLLISNYYFQIEKVIKYIFFGNFRILKRFFQNLKQILKLFF